MAQSREAAARRERELARRRSAGGRKAATKWRPEARQRVNTPSEGTHDLLRVEDNPPLVEAKPSLKERNPVVLHKSTQPEEELFLMEGNLHHGREWLTRMQDDVLHKQVDDSVILVECKAALARHHQWVQPVPNTPQWPLLSAMDPILRITFPTVCQGESGCPTLRGVLVPRLDNPRVLVLRLDCPRVLVPRLDSPRVLVLRLDCPRALVPRLDGPRALVPHLNGPRALVPS